MTGSAERYNARYPFLPQTFEIAVVSCAALSGPPLTDDRQFYYQADEDLTKTKIDLMLEGLRRMKCTAAVLSAFGCGAFGNPPDVIARLFKDALDREPAGSSLREVFRRCSRTSKSKKLESLAVKK